MRTLTLPFLPLLLPLALAAPNCPPLGPVFEPPLNFLTSPSLAAALANLTETFSARDTDNSPGVLANSTSWSIEVFTADSTHPTLFSWHHTAPELSESNGGGVNKTDTNTVYRLGSLTKVFTVYAWLAEDGDKRWSDKITQYIPELAEAARRSKEKGLDAVREVDWSEVTVGSLAGQISGAIRDYGLMGELTQQMNQSTATGLGFPPLNANDTTLPTCGAWPLCNRTEFFNGLLQAYPSYAPFTTPAYTNVGYQIMAYALEGITGKKFEDILNQRVLEPLGLKHTFYNAAPVEVGIVPGERAESGWDFLLGDENPAGSMFSSVGDISALGRSILRSDLLSPALTRRWLKPAALTSELIAGVGYPWGIRRVVVPYENGKRVVDAFNKAGRIGYYSALIILLPDYGMGFSIAIAGPAIPGNTNFNIADILGSQLVPALEAASREQAEERYSGVYVDGNGGNSSLRLTTQPDRPGLGIDEWTSNGVDMRLVGVVLSAGYQPVTPSIRLYPTGLETLRPDGSKKVAFKAVYEDIGLPSRPNSMFSTDCGTWVSFTGVSYGTYALDQFLFEVDKGGRVVSIESLALRSVLVKER